MDTLRTTEFLSSCQSSNTSIGGETPHVPDSCCLRQASSFKACIIHILPVKEALEVVKVASAWILRPGDAV